MRTSHWICRFRLSKWAEPPSCSRRLLLLPLQSFGNSVSWRDTRKIVATRSTPTCGPRLCKVFMRYSAQSIPSLLLRRKKRHSFGEFHLQVEVLQEKTSTYTMCSHRYRSVWYWRSDNSHFVSYQPKWQRLPLLPEVDRRHEAQTEDLFPWCICSHHRRDLDGRNLESDWLCLAVRQK